jgi:hypothetical protein
MLAGCQADITADDLVIIEKSKEGLKKIVLNGRSGTAASSAQARAKQQIAMHRINEFVKLGNADFVTPTMPTRALGNQIALGWRIYDYAVGEAFRGAQQNTKNRGSEVVECKGLESFESGFLHGHFVFGYPQGITDDNRLKFKNDFIEIFQRKVNKKFIEHNIPEYKKDFSIDWQKMTTENQGQYALKDLSKYRNIQYLYNLPEYRNIFNSFSKKLELECKGAGAKEFFYKVYNKLIGDLCAVRDLTSDEIKTIKTIFFSHNLNIDTYAFSELYNKDFQPFKKKSKKMDIQKVNEFEENYKNHLSLDENLKIQIAKNEEEKCLGDEVPALDTIKDSGHNQGTIEIKEYQFYPTNASIVKTLEESQAPPIPKLVAFAPNLRDAIAQFKVYLKELAEDRAEEREYDYSVKCASSGKISIVYDKPFDKKLVPTLRNYMLHYLQKKYCS